ncbi:hypothetical protein H4R99_003479 [Coemansia sp. RSA 1722]|nr:hypothetical protein H4R99_003479 [Coemansia sp. RSA 1722]
MDGLSEQRRCDARQLPLVCFQDKDAVSLARPISACASSQTNKTTWHVPCMAVALKRNRKAPLPPPQLLFQPRLPYTIDVNSRQRPIARSDGSSQVVSGRRAAFHSMGTP